MDCSTCTSFTITGESETVSLRMPQWGGEKYTINKEIDIFDFWSGNFDTNDNGIGQEPLTLAGIDVATCDEEMVCVPLCMPLCASAKYYQKFIDISDMMINHEEVTISGLGDCIDGVYVIQRFSFKSLNRPLAFEWQMTLQFVRSI